MSKIPPHIIDEIMQTSRIEEVIGEFVNLKRAGSNLKGLSPFTDKKHHHLLFHPLSKFSSVFRQAKAAQSCLS